MSSGFLQAQGAAQGSRPVGGAVCKGLEQSSELSAGGGGGGPSGPFPKWAPMLRVLTSTLRFPRPWKPLETRGCSSNPRAAGREIQVCALAGPNQGIAEILMNRPSARNALGNVFVSQLLEALAQLREDRQVRVLIFRSGVKGVFCAGQAPRTSFLRREMLHPRPTTRSKRMRVELRTDSAVALEGTPGRREEAAEGEGGKRVILRQFQGHVAQSPGLNCQDPHEQPGAGGGKRSMRTSLP